jgi:hypothetical protein
MVDPSKSRWSIPTRRAGKTEEATLLDVRAPPVAATELDLIAPVLLVAGSGHVNEWRLDVWLLLGQRVPRWGLSSICTGLR